MHATTRLAATVALILWPAAAGEQLQADLLDPKILENRLEQGMVPEDRRESTIADMFRSVGCEVELEKVTRKTNNVICTLKGAGTGSIVVGAHYDYVAQGKGIIDDWSGTAMLVSLYQSLKLHPRQHTYHFVAFSKEETGLEGSKKYVHDLDAAGLARLRAFVNLECLGTSPLKVWQHRADPGLLLKLQRLAASLHTTVPGVNVEKVGDDDTHPFLNARLPVITLHSITQETLYWIHNKKDRLESIHALEYYDSYKLIALYLVYLDSVSN